MIIKNYRMEWGGRGRLQLGRGREAGEDYKTRFLNLNTLKTVQYCV